MAQLVKETKGILWWDPYRNVGLLRMGDSTAALHPGSNLALIQGDQILDLLSFSLKDNVPSMDKKDWELLLDAMGRTPDQKKSLGDNYRVGAIIIDPGHGGRDPGAKATHTIDGVPRTLLEKDITLQVSLELNKLVQEAWPEKKIVLTRNDDTYPTLEQRVEIAHGVALKPQETVLFLSIHVNASLNTQAQGLEVWFIPKDYEREVLRNTQAHEKALPILNDFQNYEYKVESKNLSRYILQSLEVEVGKDFSDRGLKESPWFVVRMAKMPAVLVEIGFLTNSEEATRLADSEYLKKLARGIYNGLSKFIADYDALGSY